jgi:transcriptional regulator with XRE-family HTH domain
MARRTNKLALAIGARIEIARQASGLTIRELGKTAMVHRNTVLKLSRGDTLNPGVATLFDLAAALGVTPDWLILGKGPGPGQAKLDS